MTIDKPLRDNRDVAGPEADNERRKAVRRQTLLVGGLVLVGFCLRLFNLAGPCLRGDEAFAAGFSARSMSYLIEGLRTTEPHPPLYYVILHYWQLITGGTEFSLRFVSVVAGTLVIPATYGLGRRLLGRAPAIVAATLIAVNPFLFWHSQDARMYTLLLATGTLALLLAVSWAQSPKLWILAGYILMALMAAGTHYVALLVPIIATVLVAVEIIGKKELPRHVVQWVGAHIALLLLYLPWVWLAQRWLGQASGDGGHALDLLSSWLTYIGTLELGTTVAPSTAQNIQWLLLGITFIGLALLILRDRRRALGLVMWGALAIGGGVALTANHGIFGPHYLILATPVCALLLAEAVSHWRGPGMAIGAVLLAVILTTSVYSVGNYLFDPAFAKSADLRPMGDYLRTNGQPGDVIIENYPDAPFGYYYRGSLPCKVVPDSASETPHTTEETLRSLVNQYDRIWLLPFKSQDWDSRGYVQSWLDWHCPKTLQTMAGTTTIVQYARPETILSQLDASPEARFGQELVLQGYRVEPHNVAPGQSMHVTLCWRVLAPTARSYTVYTHVLGPNDQSYGQKDRLPFDGAYQTTDWQAGEMLIDSYDVQIASDAPPGDYRLEIGLYHLASMERLALTETAGQPVPSGTSALVVSGITVR